MNFESDYESGEDDGDYGPDMRQTLKERQSIGRALREIKPPAKVYDMKDDYNLYLIRLFNART